MDSENSHILEISSTKKNGFEFFKLEDKINSFETSSASLSQVTANWLTEVLFNDYPKIKNSIDTIYKKYKEVLKININRLDDNIWNKFTEEEKREILFISNFYRDENGKYSLGLTLNVFLYDLKNQGYIDLINTDKVYVVDVKSAYRIKSGKKN